MTTWDQMLKRMLWQQLDFVSGMKVLDLGSGCGETSAHLAKRNTVWAVEPSESMLAERDTTAAYTQLVGSVEQLATFPADFFDVVICHNVLEYVQDRTAVMKELARVLKPDGVMSLCKHNRPGRVMQMAVLLNDFEHANELLDGKCGVSSQFGSIRYYDDEEPLKICPELALEKLYGLRTFWNLQQNQQCHPDPVWQDHMLALEMRVSGLKEYQAIAFFHHLLFRKHKGGMPMTKDMLLAQYCEANKTAQLGQIVFAGSSLMEQFPVEKLLKEKQVDVQVYNRGIGGYVCAELMQHLDVCVTDLKPRRLFINIGTNDLSDPAVTPQVLEGRYDAILTEIVTRVPQVEIYLMAYYPINRDAAVDDGMRAVLSIRTNEKISAANAMVEQLALRHGARFIDLNRALKDAHGRLKAEYTTEGMHIREEGYRAIMDDLIPYVTEPSWR